MKLIDRLISTIHGASQYNSESEVAPVCILWPDKARQWESAIPLLLERMPELYILGEYAPEKRQGPAIWLRTVFCDTPSAVPVLYLPGVSRSDLRATDNCPTELKPLAMFQFSGVFCTQENGKDWTINAFLVSRDGGLGLGERKVDANEATKAAMQNALNRLLDVDESRLKKGHLGAEFFNNLMLSGDWRRDVLRWLSDPEGYRNAHDVATWNALVSVCRALDIDAKADNGVLQAAVKLAAHDTDDWRELWNRYVELWQDLPGIRGQIAKCKRPYVMFPRMCDLEGWPQWNAEQEKTLCDALLKLEGVTSLQAREKILELECDHAPRREFIWAQMGESPLAKALKHLSFIASASPMTGEDVDQIRNHYVECGWRVDDAALRAMAYVENIQANAVKMALRAVYLPWLEESATLLQARVDTNFDMNTHVRGIAPEMYRDGDAVLFVDGLRFDLAKRLRDTIQHDIAGVEVTEVVRWSALPSITSEGKPSVFRDDMPGAVSFGNVDHEGHALQWRLASRAENLISEIRGKIAEMLYHGAKRIHIVTDHGWLLMPGGLPKTDLPKTVTESRWSRCAEIREGLQTDIAQYASYQDETKFFALAPGISSFRNGDEYAHGGLTLQECVTLQLWVTQSSQSSAPVVFEKIQWKYGVCKMTVSGGFANAVADILDKATNTSLQLGTPKPIKENGTTTVHVDDDNEGKPAVLVIRDQNGVVLAQADTIIGES